MPHTSRHRNERPNLCRQRSSRGGKNIDATTTIKFQPHNEQPNEFVILGVENWLLDKGEPDAYYTRRGDEQGNEYLGNYNQSRIAADSDFNDRLNS